MRWNDVTKNPNSSVALEYRRATLNAALRPPVTDSEAYLSALCVGRRVLCDPAVEVDHEGAPHDGADQRIRPACLAIFDASYNSITASLAPAAERVARRAAYRVACEMTTWLTAR